MLNTIKKHNKAIKFFVVFILIPLFINFMSSVGTNTPQYYQGQEENPELTEMLEQIGKTKADQKIYLLKDDDHMSSFTHRNGDIYITERNTYQYNKDELAFIVGHEIGHNQKNHVNTAYRNVVVASYLAYLVLPVPPIVKVPLLVLAFPVFVYHQSLQNESQADLCGIDNMIKAGYNPQGAISFFKKLDAINTIGSPTPSLFSVAYIKSNPSFEDAKYRFVHEILSAHPGEKERIKNIEDYLATKQ